MPEIPARTLAAGSTAAAVSRRAREGAGASSAVIAKQVGISANQAAGIARRLRKEGAIRKAGEGYTVASKW